VFMNENTPMLVGLCGRSGSGKGYISRLFEKYGIPSIDTDTVYRELTAPSTGLSPCMHEITARFGSNAALEDNSLNREYLRKLVFSGNAQALSDLNKITHKYILAETLLKADEYCKNGFNIVLIDAPLLFESGFSNICDYIVCVVASEETLVNRIMDRDGISREDAIRRLNTQISNEELKRRSDFVIYNEDDDPVSSEIEALAQKIHLLYLSKL